MSRMKKLKNYFSKRFNFNIEDLRAEIEEDNEVIEVDIDTQKVLLTKPDKFNTDHSRGGDDHEEVYHIEIQDEKGVRWQLKAFDSKIVELEKMTIELI